MDREKAGEDGRDVKLSAISAERKEDSSQAEGAGKGTEGSERETSSFSSSPSSSFTVCEEVSGKTSAMDEAEEREVDVAKKVQSLKLYNVSPEAAVMMFCSSESRR